MLKRLIFVQIISILVFVSCARPDKIRFQVDDDLVLKTTVSKEKQDGSEGLRYALERPLVVMDSQSAFSVTLNTGTAISRVVIYSGDEVVDEFTAVPPRPAGSTVYVHPLAQDTSFDGFSVFVRDAEMPVEAAGVTVRKNGVDFGDTAVIDTRLRSTITDGNPSTTYQFDVGDIVESLDGHALIALSYVYEGPRTTGQSVTVTLSSDNDAASFSLRTLEGGGEVYLYESLLGFAPQSVEVRAEGGGFSLKGLNFEKVNGFSSSSFDAVPEPLPVDLGILVEGGNREWRRSDYELYRWNMYPEILIFDTASYAVQSAFFKRLAFFVEKAQSAGSLKSDEYLRDKHGWNAHDYQAEDLARFFNRARREKFELGRYESHLKSILLEYGLLVADGDEVAPGTGGIISLSQESAPRLRSLFMQHEGYHGIFFSDSKYRDVSRDVWESLSDLEQRFWREFLLLRNYNEADEFLVVNEMQAYLMQISADRLVAYFWDYTVPNLAKFVPRTAGLVDDLRREHPEIFHRSALQLESYLQKFAGIGAEDLFCLEKIE